MKYNVIKLLENVFDTFPYTNRVALVMHNLFNSAMSVKK